MNFLFEYSDKLNSPYECFYSNSNDAYFPIRPHWHYFVEIIYMLEGFCMMSCDKNTYHVKPGDMMLFFPRTIHSIYAATSLPIRYAVLKFDPGQLTAAGSAASATFCGIHFPSLLESAREDPLAQEYFPGEILSHLPIRNLFLECIQEMEQQQYGCRILVQSRIQYLLTQILRIWRKQGFDTDRALTLPRKEDSIYSITEYIDTHAHLSLKVEELAERCHMSYSYFAKCFRETYGQSCKKYIEFIRVSKAEDLLQFTNLDMNYISQETGFSDCSHFIKVFKQWKGVTPKQFRLKHSG